MTYRRIALVGSKAGGRQHIVATATEGDPLLLLPEPDNPHDPHAVRVCHLPARLATDSYWGADGWEVGPDDRVTMQDRQAGYLPRDVAARCDLPPEGIPATAVEVRFAPEDAYWRKDNAGRRVHDDPYPVGFDVAADLTLGRKVTT